MRDSSPPAEPQWHEPWPRHSGVARAGQVFEDEFGAEPEGTWSAAGRVNLIGEHTDYNAGLCLPTLIRHRTYVAGSRRDDAVLSIVSSEGDRFDGPGRRWECGLDDISAETAEGWPAYPAGVVWALRERGYDGPGLNLAITSCVPLGSGLSSSASLSCSTARAVNDLWRLSLDTRAARVDLAEAARDAENLIAGTPTGQLDQYATLYCQEGSAIEIDCATSPPGMRDTPLYFPEYGLVLLIIDTRHPRHVTDGRYAERYDECQRAARALGTSTLREVADGPDPLGRVEALEDETLRKRARHVVTEIERVRVVRDELAGTAPAHERFVNVGRQMYRSHTSLASDFDVSSPELDLAVNAAWTSGALGARLVGAGFGGAAIALVRRTQMDVSARIIDRAFAEAGLDRPRFTYV